jgi:hypothetical protein
MALSSNELNIPAISTVIAYATDTFLQRLVNIYAHYTIFELFVDLLLTSCDSSHNEKAGGSNLPCLVQI